MPLEFHENAKAAAEAAMGVVGLAGPDAFWSFQSSAFATRLTWGLSDMTFWAETSGVRDLDAFHKGRELGRWRPKVEAIHTREIARSGRHTAHVCEWHRHWRRASLKENSSKV